MLRKFKRRKKVNFILYNHRNYFLKNSFLTSYFFFIKNFFFFFLNTGNKWDLSYDKYNWVGE